MHSEVMCSAADIAQSTGLTPRMINLYRAQAEKRLGVKFGRKEGRTTYFNAEEIREILKAREAGNTGNPGNSQNFQEAVNFSKATAQAEDGTLSGMEAIVAATDQQAIAMGQAIGQRFNNLMWTTAIQTMSSGMVQMTQQFSEMHEAIALPLRDAPQLLGGGSIHSPQLEGGSDDD